MLMSKSISATRPSIVIKIAYVDQVAKTTCLIQKRRVTNDDANGKRNFYGAASANTAMRQTRLAKKCDNAMADREEPLDRQSAAHHCLSWSSYKSRCRSTISTVPRFPPADVQETLLLELLVQESCRA